MQQPVSKSQAPLAKASAFADSAYFSNIEGKYQRTLQFADSCRYYLNKHYHSLQPRGRYLMRPMGNPSLLAPEIKWFHDGVETNYHIILDIRNESAVAALALHEWQLYSYNNRIYTQLFKEMSADETLGDYCRTMQQTQTNQTISVILLVLLLLSIVPAYYLLYYRHRLYDRFVKEQQRQNDLEMLNDEYRRAELEDNNLHVSNAVLDNCLSTLKHVLFDSIGNIDICSSDILHNEYAFIVFITKRIIAGAFSCYNFVNAFGSKVVWTFHA